MKDVLKKAMGTVLVVGTVDDPIRTVAEWAKIATPLVARVCHFVDGGPRRLVILIADVEGERVMIDVSEAMQIVCDSVSGNVRRGYLLREFIATLEAHAVLTVGTIDLGGAILGNGRAFVKGHDKGMAWSLDGDSFATCGSPDVGDLFDGSLEPVNMEEALGGFTFTQKGGDA